MTYIQTLSQSFDNGDFIAPDILKSVDDSVRATAADVLGQGSLAGDLERLFDIQATAPILSDAVFHSWAPAMNPDEFMPYEPPKAPEIMDFDFGRVWGGVSADGAGFDFDFSFGSAGADAAADAEKPEPFFESGFEDRFENDEVDIRIPDLVHIQVETYPEQEDISVEIPEIDPVNADLRKVQIDTLRFDAAFRVNGRRVVFIAVIAVVVVVLVVYILHQ